MEKTTIVIVVEDGMIQDVLASNKNIEVEVLDMDFAEDYDEYERKQDNGLSWERKWTLFINCCTNEMDILWGGNYGSRNQA